MDSLLNVFLLPETEGSCFQVVICVSAVLTLLLHSLQLLAGMANYREHKKQLRQGIFEDIPWISSQKEYSIMGTSVKYSGFLVGYIAWGFVISFHIILFVLGLICLLLIRISSAQLLVGVLVPVIVVCCLRSGSLAVIIRCISSKDDNKTLKEENRRSYAILVYFGFFASKFSFFCEVEMQERMSFVDCFIGIASCIMRLLYGTGMNLWYMGRIDCSYLIRPWETSGKIRNMINR